MENRPVTGATFYRHCLEDLNERLAGLGEELGALEMVSLDAISLEVRSSWVLAVQQRRPLCHAAGDAAWHCITSLDHDVERNQH